MGTGTTRHVRGCAGQRSTRLLLVVTLGALLLVAVPVGGASAGPASASPQQVVAAQDERPACPETVPPAGFPDVVGNPHEPNVDCVAWYGLAQGTLPGAYAPANSVQRDQMATFLVRLLERAGEELPEQGSAGFDDIEGNTHQQAIEQLAALGIVEGTRGGGYEPARAVRRDQMASFLVRTYEHLLEAELEAPSSGFDDTAGNAHQVNIDKAAAAGLARGTSGSTYEPANPVRRDQMASFLARTLGLAVGDGFVTPRSAPSPAFTATSRLHPRGAGGVLAGMTLREVERVTGSALVVSEFETFGRYCYYAEKRDLPGVYLLVVAPQDPPPSNPRDGIVVRVTSHRYEEPNLRTVAGVRPGNQRAAVRAAYGSAQVETRRHIYQPDGAYLDVIAADGQHGFRFEVGGDGRISAIHAGDANAITWPEGCA